MNATEKTILRNSIIIHHTSSKQERVQQLLLIESRLKEHERAIEAIGSGYCLNTVRAGQIFLRIFKK